MPWLGLSAHSFSRQSACSGQVPGSCVWVVFVSGPGSPWDGSQHCLGSYSVVAVAIPAASLGALILGAFGV